MMIKILEHEISRVVIVDDEASVRQGYEWSVQDLKLIPVPISGPIGRLEGFVENFLQYGEAGIFDFKLSTVGDYASFNGAESVASLFKRKIPAILCTRWEMASMPDIRRHRRWIPVMIRPDELAPEILYKGFEVCIGEIGNVFLSGRRPSRVLVRLEDFDEQKNVLNVTLPGWDRNQVVQLYLDSLPFEISSSVKENKIQRLFAQVNLGAENQQDLFFDAWEMGA